MRKDQKEKIMDMLSVFLDGLKYIIQQPCDSSEQKTNILTELKKVLIL